ncbi:hypothetical protein [Saccharothrix sp. Mg75]|uniref:hypothetical protein n=1 Tax=Saccharothrix sp. Mg75 TaxID=3445357 RepID=UPI003EED665D
MTGTHSRQPADFMAAAFARLGLITRDPTDLHMGLVFRMTGPRPSLDLLRARVAARIERLSPLRQRLVHGEDVHGGDVHGGDVCWEDDPDFDVAHHVRELPAHVGVLPARTVLADSFAPERPPWGLWTAPDGPDSWSLYYLTHHARQDAGAAVRTVTALLGEEEPAAVRTAAVRRSRRRGWSGLLALAPDLARTYAPAPTATPGEHGPGRVLGQRAVPLSALKDIAGRTGATVNQVHLAAMAEALDRWAPGGSPRQIALPMETRSGEEDDRFTNRIGLMRVALPGGDVDRVRGVVAAAGRRRLERHRRAWRDVADHASHRAAGWAQLRITDPSRVAVTLSNIRVASPLVLLGAPVTDVTAIPWLPPGHTCFGLLVGYGDVARLSVLAPEGAPDPAELVDLWHDAVDALHHRHVGARIATTG